MVRLSRHLLLILAAAALIAGCGGSDSTDSTAEDSSGTEAFDKATLPDQIEVDAGGSFEISLDANNTTPYHWVFTTKPDPKILSFESRDYETDPGSEGLTGAGGTETFKFEGVAAGTTEIGLAYEDLSGDGPTTDKVEAKVTVR